MTHPMVYGAAIAVGALVYLYTFFKNRQSENNYQQDGHPPPPPPYDYPRKENETKKRRNPENDDSQTYNRKCGSSKSSNSNSGRRSPPPPYKEKETDGISSPPFNSNSSTIRQRRPPQNDASGNEERNRHISEFQGLPHYLHENNAIDRNPVDEINSITDANSLEPGRTDTPISLRSSATSRSFDILSENESLGPRGSNHEREAESSISLQSGRTVLTGLNNSASAFVPVNSESLVNSASFEVLSGEASNDDNLPSFGSFNFIKCAVCSKHIDKENPTEAVPCKHYFHFQCITDHLRTSKACPWCKNNIKSLNF